MCVRVRGRERGAWKEREAGSLSEKQEREREREIVFYVLFSMFSVLVDYFIQSLWLSLQVYVVG